jgi:protoheme IX farnesyltransferase
MSTALRAGRLYAGGDLRTDAAPGAWLRSLAVIAGGAALLVVVSGTLGARDLHRLLAVLALPPLVALLVAATVAHRRLLPAALASLVLFLTTAAVPGRSPHLLLAVLTLVAVAVLTAASFRGAEVPRGRLADYVALTKPRIMSLLLLTGGCGMFVGAGGAPPPAKLGLTLLGLALACGGASALNHVIDRDIDPLMGPRTAARPVASGRMPASRALEFGLALSAASFTLLGTTVNLPAAALALVGNLFYVVVYTGYLKRRGPANIVLGGAAGAVPPLVGYAAATGNLALPALWLFLIVFLWTPPHFWALALLIRDHYANAKVPMLPVVAGERETVTKIVRYSVALVAFTAVPFLTGSLGAFYLVSAAVLGALFLALALRLRRRVERHDAAVLFHYSLLYLALLFVAAAIDALL